MIDAKMFSLRLVETIAVATQDQAGIRVLTLFLRSGNAKQPGHLHPTNERFRQLFHVWLTMHTQFYS